MCAPLNPFKSGGPKGDGNLNFDSLTKPWKNPISLVMPPEHQFVVQNDPLHQPVRDSAFGKSLF